MEEEVNIKLSDELLDFVDWKKIGFIQGVDGSITEDGFRTGT